MEVEPLKLLSKTSKKVDNLLLIDHLWMREAFLHLLTMPLLMLRELWWDLQEAQDLPILLESKRETGQARLVLITLKNLRRMNFLLC
jgi:hypothetical protein